MSLVDYRRKRDFSKTLEPKGEKAKGTEKSFVVQKHDASHLHYDFRLEIDGVLKSWAVPKGPSMDPRAKRLAVQVEDHPLKYGSFEGEIPKGEYGAGKVIVSDRGRWKSGKASVQEQLKKGKLEFELEGEKLKGKWVLVRLGKSASARQPSWFLIKRSDSAAQTDYDILDEDRSVISGVTVEDAAEAKLKNLKPPSTPKNSAKKSASAKAKLPKKEKLPTFIEPQLALLADTSPPGSDWLFEIKFDGYRTHARVEKNKVKFLTRNGLDWTEKYKELKTDFEKLKVQSAILDGEIVVNDTKGTSSFFKLQEALKNGTSEDLVFYAFDLLHLNGHSLIDEPLESRKAVLKELLQMSKVKKIVFSEHTIGNGNAVFRSACSDGLEGIIAKNRKSSYHSGRGSEWLKVKCKNAQEFVIGGFRVQSNGSLGALLMGLHNEKGELQYVGKVGTGFTDEISRAMTSRLRKLETAKSPFTAKSPREKGVMWVNPKLVANIEFASWTSDQNLRHASFKGLREDKKSRQVGFDAVLKSGTSSTLTHPDKLLFKADKVSKRDLSSYYFAVEKWIMPHIQNRPLSVLRCPNGKDGQCFFQKHVAGENDSLHTQKVKSKTKNRMEEIIYIDSEAGLQEMVQLNCLELHSWGCLRSDIDKPVLIVFDFDPGPGVTWAQIKKGTTNLRELLEKLDLKSFVKTSGGKGLHVHVPIAPLYTWDQVKDFAKTVCQALEQKNDLYTTTISKKERNGKIFLDYLRNGYGATAISPYSVRARAGAPVAVPITWQELAKLKSADVYTVKNIERFLAKRKDPWPGYLKMKQKIGILKAK